MGTLVWTDDFESYAAGAIVAPWVVTNNSVVTTAQAHGGTKSLAAGTGGNGSTCYRPIGSNLSQWYADFWMWTNPVGGSTNQFISFAAIIAGGGSCPFVNVSSTGGAGRCGSTSTWFTFTVSLSVWHHYVFEVTSALAGTAKLTVDGVVAGTFSGDTRDAANNTFVAYAYLVGAPIGPSPPAEFYVDDLSIYSGVNTPASTQGARIMVLA